MNATYKIVPFKFVHTILSIPFCPTPFCPIPFCPYHFVRYHFVRSPNRAFLAAGLSIWNGLPFELRSLPRDFSSSFYSLLKTFLFPRPGLGALLSSYLQGALYKFHR